jgi:tetraacyldisaccharide 4'-kinase
VRFALLCRRGAPDAARRLPLPVLSVGNATWGGSGKTPLTEHLARRCLALGATPLILTRGYGCASSRHHSHAPQGLSSLFSHCSGGDEARMLRAALAGTPARVAVGADRHASATAVLRSCAASGEAAPDVAILDDGLQHFRLRRDADVVCVDALALWGSGKRVPAGPLREAPAHALRRAAALVLHNWPLASQAQRDAATRATQPLLQPGTLRLHSHLQPLPTLHPHDLGSDDASPPASVPIEALRGAPAVALSGLGNPRALELQLRALGASAVAALSVGDHAPFTYADVARAAEAAVALAARTGRTPWLVITAKDSARDADAGALSEHALRAAGVACAGGRALVLRGALRFVRADDPDDADVAGAAAMDELLRGLLARPHAK